MWFDIDKNLSIVNVDDAKVRIADSREWELKFHFDFFLIFVTCYTTIIHISSDLSSGILKIILFFLCVQILCQTFLQTMHVSPLPVYTYSFAGNPVIVYAPTYYLFSTRFCIVVEKGRGGVNTIKFSYDICLI